jgi:DNA repair exonuclease SbcCD ATPase subunit
MTDQPEAKLMHNETGGGLLPPVPMTEHLAVVQAMAQANAKADKAKRIIEVMKSQIGLAHATIAELQIDLANAMAESEQRLVELRGVEARLAHIDAERKGLVDHAAALEEQLKTARAVAEKLAI